MKIFTLTKEQMEQQASVVWGICIERLRRDGAITQEQATDYQDYTVVMMTKESLADRLMRFFKKDTPESETQFKFKVVNMREEMP